MLGFPASFLLRFAHGRCKYLLVSFCRVCKSVSKDIFGYDTIRQWVSVFDVRYWKIQNQRLGLNALIECK